MSRRYAPNLTDVSAGIPLLDAGEYEFIIGEPKPFARQSQGEGGIIVEIYGVSVGLKIVAGPSHEGKSIPHQLYLHSEAAQPMVKQFLMAAHGVGRNDEQAFNEQFSDPETDWVVDTESGELGEAYKGIAGKRVLANVSQRASKRDPNVMQNNFTWVPA